MTKSKFIRVFGFMGALLTGISSIISGDLITGSGIIAAALSSVSVFKKESP